DATKKVSEENIELMKEAIRLSASSYGFQAYKVLVVTNDEVRKQLLPNSWGQSQIVDASHLFIFCAKRNFTEDDVDGYIKLKSETQNIPLEALGAYADFMKGSLKGKSQEEISGWNARQTYIALGNLLAAAAELGVDSCPMEGFDPVKYDEILGLESKGLTSTVLVPVGYRSAEDNNQNMTKVRKSKEDLFEHIN
ncbi:MAG: NAD(P)H-dependent oxidoreductase, partial [Saprospiraceae bacterium]